MNESPRSDPPQPARAEFAPTRWSVVERARGPDDALARDALEQLVRSYRFPLHAYLRRRGLDAHDADDALQGLFARMIEQRERWRVDRAKGRFRAWLLGALKHYVGELGDRERAAKRGGGRTLSLDQRGLDEHESRYAVEARADEDPERLFERLWSLEVARAALERLERSELAAGRGAAWRVLGRFVARASEAGEYEAAARELGLREVALKVAVHRLRERYRDALEDEVRETLSDGSAESVREELAALLASLR
ncbi:MAG: sigma-70 family RNA polymerase sigma factor [Planctomycetota bacterium]|nr:MAG: sigma-70 family RNA polymerase sigma factor [Planctomycetota bacterium]